MLPLYSVLDPRIEQLPRKKIVQLQEERLKAQLHHIYDNSPFYHERFRKAGVTPDSIRSLEDLRKLPFTTRRELEESQKRYPPLGNYTCTPQSHWHKFMATTGTTGRPLRRVFSKRDWDYVLDKFCRWPTVRPGEVAIALRPVDALMGSLAGSEAWARQGALVVCAGLYDTKSKIRLMQELRPAAVSGTASLLLYIGEVAEGMGVTLADIGSIRVLTSAGEPGAAILATRRRIERMWGAFLIDGYGLTEIFPLARNCRKSLSLHLPDDFVITEVVDLKTGEVLPPGERGELVYTNIIGDTQPLLRYRSGDIGAITYEPCACGYTHTRIINGIEGRVDDLIWYKGVNIFPTAIEGVVRGFEELTGEFRIVLWKQGPSQFLTVKAEVKRGVAARSKRRLQELLAQELKGAISVNAEVVLIPEGSLPRGEDKARRVIDKR